MKKYILKSLFALSIAAISLVSCVSDNDYKIPEFTIPFYEINFEDHEIGTSSNIVPVNIPNTINTNLTSTPLWEVRAFSGNSYMQFSSYNNPIDSTDNAWFILPEVDLGANQKLSLSFKLAQAFPSGTFPLKIYYSTDFDGNANNIETSSWTSIPFVFPSATANYVFINIKDLSYLNEGNEIQKVYFAFNYKGAKTNGSTTNIQIDDIKLTMN